MHGGCEVEVWRAEGLFQAISTDWKVEGALSCNWKDWEDAYVLKAWGHEFESPESAAWGRDRQILGTPGHSLAQMLNSGF